ncbi:MAG TPA: bifunctional (p)ppGpp synthetase/guanosine-3',5'-bis(diphosphate) 3'-pyrophosphohydrolase [Rhodanobacteraceae bacterium]|nr:bifunctional (p)ppGpp synthetase/guanosine-3',5'-bis(diphosphate) 3'-pyrophosphohydrolase [Rhodanobacteraceae bacterium]
MKASAVLLQNLEPAQRQAAIAALPRELAQAFDTALPLQAQPLRQRQTGQTLAILEQLGCDEETLAAAVRFDTWQAAGSERGTPWPAELSATQRRLLDGQLAAERVWTLHAERSPGSGVEGLRRLLLAIIGDLRVVFILLARQLARLRAAGSLPEAERRALAALCVDIHAPLANRLGIGQLKWELEDLAFSFLQPATYRRIARLLDEGRAEREAFIKRCLSELGRALDKAGIRADLAGRPKHVYSIWRKMQRKGLEFSELFDIRAVRVLVDDIPACYAALGVVHGVWMHVPKEFDDYIARPKGNGYRSLHTAVAGPLGKTLEVQIRTHEMHQANELGVASHWRYKEGGGGDAAFEAKIAWMRKLLEARGDGEGDDAALLAGFRTELLEDRVYLLTPRGDVFDLPAGASVLDFAYHVHTDVGHRCRGAKVNGRIVPLGFQPQTGDRIEILTAKQAEPRRDWLSAQSGYLNTHRAREKVRAWFRRTDLATNLAAGQAILDRELRRVGMLQAGVEDLHTRFNLKSHEDLLVALALGETSAGQVARVLHESLAPTPASAAPASAGPTQPPLPTDAFCIEGVGNLLSSLAGCCQPLPGDPVRGYITRGRGISVHRADCKALSRLTQREPDRVIEVSWGARNARSYLVDVLVRGYDRKDLLKDVGSAIANAGAHVAASATRSLPKSAEVDMRFSLRVRDFGQLSDLLVRLDALPGVLEARRLADGF